MGLEDTHQFDRHHTRELPRTTAVKQTRRLAVLVVGGSLITLGLALIVLPGPFTIPPVLLGLTILSWEFGWAKRLRYHLKAKAKQLRNQSLKR
ncbi:MAG: PGPGW domain-containing protein [Actinomycetota bacterium]